MRERNGDQLCLKIHSPPPSRVSFFRLRTAEMKHWSLTTFVNLANKRLKGMRLMRLAHNLNRIYAKMDKKLQNKTHGLYTRAFLFFLPIFVWIFLELNSQGASKKKPILNPVPPYRRVYAYRKQILGLLTAVIQSVVLQIEVNLFCPQMSLLSTSSRQ